MTQDQLSQIDKDPQEDHFGGVEECNLEAVDDADAEIVEVANV